MRVSGNTGSIYIFVVVLSTIIIIPINALKCSCNTDRGTRECVDGTCEFKLQIPAKETRKALLENSEKLVPFCAAIRHPKHGEIYACALASNSHNRKCEADFIPRENVTVEKCWCNTEDFCNDDFFAPANGEEEKENDEKEIHSTISNLRNENTISSVEGKVATFPQNASAPGLESQQRISDDKQVINSADDSKLATTSEFETATPIVAKLEDSFSMKHFREKTTTNEQKSADDFDSRRFSTIIENDSVENSIDIGRVTSALDDGQSTRTPVVVREKIETNLIRPMRTGYSNTSTVVAKGSSSIPFCGDGECRKDASPVSSVTSFYGIHSTSLSCFLMCVLILVVNLL